MSILVSEQICGEGLTLEQSYHNVPRRSGPQARSSVGRKTKRRRSPLAVLGIALYKFIVVVSALIVGVFVVWNIMVKPPDQTQMDPPTIPGTGEQTDPTGGVTNVGNTEDPDALVRRDDVYNIFLAGTDNEGLRTDTMMVVSYDVKNKTVDVVSIPRDTITDRAKGKHAKLVYGSGGVEQRVKDVSNMLGIPIDYYIKVNLKGFIALVDYLDGIDFYVPCNMNYDDPYQDLAIHYKEGMQHLDGKQAMEVARFRKNNENKDGNVTGYNDTGRTDTQQKLLIALAKKVLSWNSLTKINGFVEIFNDNVDTDLSLSNMLYFASQAVSVDLGTGVEATTLEGRGDAIYRGYTWCVELNRESTVETVNRMINPFTRDLTLDDMNLRKADSYHN